jgi:hypothetical protein
MIDAFNARDFDRILAEFDPEIEFHSRFTTVGGVYRGHDGGCRGRARSFGLCVNAVGGDQS